jgi:hypothetical protein
MGDAPSVEPWREDYPKLAAYHDQLPHGWDSYPGYRAAGTLVHWFTAHSAFDSIPVLPAPLERVRRNAIACRIDDTIPEVVFIGLVLAVHERVFTANDEEFLAWFTESSLARVAAVQRDHEMNADISTLIRAAPSLWARYHPGVVATVERLSSVEAVTRIDHPARLFPPIILRAFGRMSQIALVRRDAALIELATETTMLGDDRAATRIAATWTIAAHGPRIEHADPAANEKI